MNLQIENNQIKIGFANDPVDLIHKTKAAGLVWAPHMKVWQGPADYRTAMALVERMPDLEPELRDYLPKSVDWVPSPYLMDHQKSGAALALQHSRFGFFWDCGLGKTLTGIEIVKQKKLKTLVVCPLSIITNAWVGDAKSFAPELRIANLWELKRRKIPEHDIGIINFEYFRTSYKQLTGYKMVFIDESAKIKSYKSQITKALISYCDSIPYVYLFSGDPSPNSNLEYWSQMRIIDQSLFGRSYYSFRNRYCYSTGFGGYTWKMKADMEPDFLEKIGTKSKVLRKEDILDLPERTFSVRDVYLDEKEETAYRKMEKEMILEIGSQESVAANAAVKIMKLREGTSGFFYDTDGFPIQTGTSKLNELRSLIQEIGPHQVLIWYQYRYEGDQIGEMLSHSFGRVDGSVANQKLKDEVVNDFIKGDLQYLIAHPASLGHGVNLQHCSYAIYYSLDYSYERYYQSAARIYRKGQINRCSYYFLIAKKTVDEVILRALEKKENMATAIFSYIKNIG